jgi:hypothetical protein
MACAERHTLAAYENSVCFDRLRKQSVTLPFDTEISLKRICPIV